MIIYTNGNGSISILTITHSGHGISKAISLPPACLLHSPPKGPTTSSAGGMGKPPWGKTFAFPPKGGLANRSFFTGRPLKSGFLLMLHPIPFVLLLNILLYCLFVDITDRFAIISSCPEVTVSFLSIFWMPVKYHKRTLAFNKAYGL